MELLNRYNLVKVHDLLVLLSEATKKDTREASFTVSPFTNRETSGYLLENDVTRISCTITIPSPGEWYAVHVRFGEKYTFELSTGYSCHAKVKHTQYVESRLDVACTDIIDWLMQETN